MMPLRVSRSQHAVVHQAKVWLLNTLSNLQRDHVPKEGKLQRFWFLFWILSFIVRPACADKSEIFNLKCSDGGVPTLGVGTYPKCAAGNLVCQNGEDLKCLVDGQLTDQIPNFGM